MANRAIYVMLVVFGLLSMSIGSYFLYNAREWAWLAWLIILSTTMTLSGGLRIWFEEKTQRALRSKHIKLSTSAIPTTSTSTTSSFATANNGNGDQHKDGSGSSSVPDDADDDVEDDWRLGWRVCGITSLFVLAVVSIIALSLMFSELRLNTPYHVNFRSMDTLSSSVRSGKSESGLTYFIKKNTYRRDKFSALLRVKVGTFEEEDDEIGLAHFAEHVAIDSSTRYPERHGIQSQFYAMGAKLHAYTSHRSTVFSLVDIPLSPHNLLTTLVLLRELSLNQKPMPSQIEIEKRVLGGEERLFNSSSALVHKIAYCNHLGNAHRLCKHFPYGQHQQIERFSERDVLQFFEKWYHPQNMNLYLVGDFNILDVERHIKDYWKDASRPTPQIATTNRVSTADIFAKRMQMRATSPDPKPAAPFLFQTVEGFDGISFNLVVSTPYRRPVHSANFHRRKILNKIVSGVFRNQFFARLKEYGSIENMASMTDIEVLSKDDYDIYRSVFEVRLTILGNPEKGDWRRFFEIFFVELRRLGEFGPHVEIVRQFIETAKMVLEARKAFSSFQDSSTFVQLIMGNTDPDYVYMDPVDILQVEEQFLNNGFLDSAVVHIQSTSQYLWQALVKAVANRTLTTPPYNNLINSTASAVLITDTPSPSKAVSYTDVSQHEIVILLQKVLDEVLVPLPPTIAIQIEEAFMDHAGFNKMWRNRVRSHIGTERIVFEHASQSKNSYSALDGLPTFGTLVDQRRLYNTTASNSSSDIANTWKFIDNFPPSGVKRYELSNGLRVNLKRRLSGRDRLPCDAPGIVDMEVVSLGGKATQPPSLLGACELVNMNVAGRFLVNYKNDHGEIDESFYDSHLVESYTRNIGHPTVQCKKEFFTIKQRLHSKCMDVDTDECTIAHSHFMKKLEAVRVVMFPLYDENSIETGAKSFLSLLDRAEHSRRPTDYIQLRLHQQLLSEWLDKNDTRLRDVTADDIRALDPVQVGQWVKEQFTTNRMEVNIVGDFDEESLLEQIELMLGTIPLAPTSKPSTATTTAATNTNTNTNTNEVAAANPKPDSKQQVLAPGTPTRQPAPSPPQRIGHDIFDAADVNHFQYSNRHAHGLELNCSMIGVNPLRAFVDVIVPLNSDFTSLRGHHIAMLTDAVVERTVFNILTRDNGYYRIQWCAGLRSIHDNPINEVRSSLAAVQTLISPEFGFDSQTFEHSKAALLSTVRGELQQSATWLTVLRGVSLRSPSWAKHLFPTVKDVAQTDLLGSLARVTLDQVNAYFRDHLQSNLHLFPFAIVETVTQASDAKLGGTLCDWKRSSQPSPKPTPPPATVTPTPTPTPPSPSPAAAQQQQQQQQQPQQQPQQQHGLPQPLPFDPQAVF